jgi:hypothetical protein
MHYAYHSRRQGPGPRTSFKYKLQHPVPTNLSDSPPMSVTDHKQWHKVCFLQDGPTSNGCLISIILLVPRAQKNMCKQLIHWNLGIKSQNLLNIWQVGEPTFLAGWHSREGKIYICMKLPHCLYLCCSYNCWCIGWASKIYNSNGSLPHVD